MTKKISTESDRHFDTIAADFVKKDLVPYCRIMRKLRLMQTLKHVDTPVGAVLEIGCGGGFAARYLRGQYRSYTGLDYARGLVAYAQHHNRDDRTLFLEKDVRRFDTADRYDVIFMIGVIHHLVDAKEILRHLRKFLKPDGVLIANEPHRGNPVIYLLRLLRTYIDPDYPKEQAFYLESELRQLFIDSGYAIRSFPQGVLSTPLAETRFLPAAIGTPLARLLKFIDPLLDRLISVPVLRRLSWNVVVEGRIADGKDAQS